MLRRPISISLRLTIWFGAVLLSGWLLFGAAMWFSLEHSLRNVGLIFEALEEVES